MSNQVPWKVTALPFQSHRDSRWYIVVQHGSIVEHLRMYDERDAQATLVRQLHVTPRRAKSMLERAAKEEAKS